MFEYTDTAPEAIACDTLTLKSALALASEGIAVFPLKYSTKEPATTRGFCNASTNQATIRRWFGGSFRYNLAVRTGIASGVWVIDVDDLKALAALEDKHGSIPTGLRSQSSRGLHLWFRTVPLPIPCSTGRIAPGIDVKGEGGYVVAPPSIHPTGVCYEWLNSEHIVEAPSWLLMLARKPTPAEPPPRAPALPVHAGRPDSYGLAALRAEIAILASAPKGGRNHQLNRAAFALFQLVAAGLLVADDVERRLVEACGVNNLVADDGIRAVMATIRSGARAGMAHPRTIPERAG